MAFVLNMKMIVMVAVAFQHKALIMMQNERLRIKLKPGSCSKTAKTWHLSPCSSHKVTNTGRVKRAGPAHDFVKDSDIIKV